MDSPRLVGVVSIIATAVGMVASIASLVGVVALIALLAVGSRGRRVNLSLVLFDFIGLEIVLSGGRVLLEVLNNLVLSGLRVFDNVNVLILNCSGFVGLGTLLCCLVFLCCFLLLLCGSVVNGSKVFGSEVFGSNNDGYEESYQVVSGCS